MKDKDILNILESLHSRIFSLESYNPPLAITKLNQLITENAQLQLHNAKWSMDRVVTRSSVNLPNNNMDWTGIGHLDPSNRVAMGGRDYVRIRGHDRYDCREARVAFTGVYDVWVKPSFLNEEFIMDRSFVLASEVIDYLNNELYPSDGYRPWERPTFSNNPREVT